MAENATMREIGQTASGEARQFIKFLATGQEFAADIMGIREIRGWSETTPVAHSADYILGVINLRGAVLPVIDLKARLGKGLSVPSSSSVIIVMQSGERLTGVLVDAVLDILTMSSKDIQDVPDVVREESNGYVDGIAVLDGSLVTLLGIEQLTAGAELLS
jgi:purine-binding chemotaxis protein CheW